MCIPLNKQRYAVKLSMQFLRSAQAVALQIQAICVMVDPGSFAPIQLRTIHLSLPLAGAKRASDLDESEERLRSCPFPQHW